MQTISVVYADLVVRPKYLHCPKTGRHDILGQILFSLGYDVPPKARVSSDLQKNIPHFTRLVRNQLQDSPLSQDIIAVSCLHHPKLQVDYVNKLFTSYKAPYQVVWAK